MVLLCESLVNARPSNLTCVEAGVLGLRKDPRLLKVPPYLSALCIFVGIAWLLLLPLDEYSRQTYVSENALLPGQVHTYFTGSEHNIFRAYRQEVAALADVSETERLDRLERILTSDGLKADTQHYRYNVAGQTKLGSNVYAVLQGPRADATEAMVLIAAWRNMDDKINYSGVALVLTLARYFKRWSLWSKDIIILIPSDSTFGPQAWVDAYHDTHDPDAVSSLSVKAGALQAAIAVDYPAGTWGHRFDKLHVVYDGVNGQLPNLDLLNTAVSIAGGQMGIGCTIQRMWNHNDGYEERLMTVFRGMLTQAVGHASGPHSSFIPYHIDAITLQTVGDGWHDEMTLGRAIEGIFRSLNNLLEHLHQSFFFYMLMHANRFVSIGTYLPSAMVVAASFTISAILLWVQGGLPNRTASTGPASTMGAKPPAMTMVKDGDGVALVPSADLELAERHLFLPAAMVLGVHVWGLIPFYALTHVSDETPAPLVAVRLGMTIVGPLILTLLIPRFLAPTRQQVALLQCFSLLTLGAALSTLATLNFSQALFIGLLASPLSFVRPLALSSAWPFAARCAVATTAVLAMLACSPLAVLMVCSRVFGRSCAELLVAAAWGWEVEGVFTAVVVCVLWWPAWVCGVVVLGSRVAVKQG